MNSNLWDDPKDNRSQFSRSDRYSRSRFQHDSRGTEYFDRTSQQTSGKMWGDADQNPSQFSPGSRIMSDRIHGYGRGSNYDFQQESRTDATSHTRGGLRPSFRDESFEKEQRIDYFGAQSRGPTGMESEVTWTRGNSRSGLEMDRLTNTSMDTVSRFGMELTGQTPTPNVEKDLGRFLSKRSKTLHPMEIGSNKLDTFEGGRNRPDIEKPRNLTEPIFNSNRTGGPYYQPRNETRTEWSHVSHRGQAAESFRESEHYRFGDMSRHTTVLQGIEQGRDSFVLDRGVKQELRMRMAAKRQHSGGNVVDRNQFSEEHAQNVSQSIGTMTRGSYGKEASASPQESRGLKRGGSMDGFRDDSSFKRGRMEGFKDRPRPSSYQQTETLRRPQSSIEPRPSSYRQTETLRRPQSSIEPRPSSYQQTETLRRPQSSIEPRPSSYQQTETLRRPQSSIEPRPSNYQQTETLRRPQSGIEPRPSSYQQTETLRRPQSSIEPRPSSYQQTETLRRPQSGIEPRPSSYQQTETPRRPQSSIQPIEKTVPSLSLDLGIPDQGLPSAPETFESMLERLIAAIRSSKASFKYFSDIATIHTCLAKCNLKRDYKIHELGTIGRNITFTGSLQVNNVFLARSVGISEKTVKHACYEKAMAVLMTNPVSEILKLEDEGIEKLRMKLLADEENKKAKKLVLAAAPTPPLTPRETFESKLERLIAAIRSSKASREYFNDIDTTYNCLAKCKLKGDYKQDSLGKIGEKIKHTGSLQVNNVFLARSVGISTKEVKHACYEKAVAVLMTNPVSEILKLEDEGIEKLRMKLLADEEIKKAEKLVVAAAPTTPRTLRERLVKLIHCLKNFNKRADTPMNELNIANISANFVFHLVYKEELIELWGNFCLIKALLMLDGHLIATAVEKEHKCVRYKTYAKGVEFLRNSPMSVVLEGVPADDDYTNLSVHDVLSHRHVSLPDHQTEQKLGRMINEVKNIVASKQPPSNTLQITSQNNHLLLTCLFKKRTRGAEQFAECDLYIDCIYICSGEGYKYADAVKRANEQAVRVLCNSSPDLIFNNFKRITTQDVHDVAQVCEFWEGKMTKTFFWSNCVKIQLLKKKMLFKTSPDYTKFPRDWEGMIVMEQDMFSSDRLNKAYEILLHTATKSFVTMFGKGTTEGNVLKCELFLQGEKLAEATGKSNLEASAKAAAKILFKLYQHQPVIKLLPEGDDSKSWHTYESIKEKADKMKAGSEDSETDDFIYINDIPPVPKQKVQEELMEVDQEDVDKDTPSSSHSMSSVRRTDVVEDGDSFVGDSDAPSSTLPVNKWVKKVVEKMISEYAETENLEELIFGPGFPLGDQKQIRITASKHRVYSGVKTATDKRNYVCVYQKLSPEMILQTLRLNDGKCGRYALIPKEELPRQEDLEQDSFGIHNNLQRSHWKRFKIKVRSRGCAESDH